MNDTQTSAMELRRNGSLLPARAPARCFTGPLRIDPPFQAGLGRRHGNVVEWMEHVTGAHDHAPAGS